MDIDTIYALSVEEFGDMAHKRFIFSCLLNEATPMPCQFGNPKNNSVIENIINDNTRPHHIKLKPIAELIAHDIEFYDKNAYLMWEYFHSPEQKWYSAGNNNFYLFNDNLRRKHSAALPFDLDRAKSGDAVEAYTIETGWQTACQFKSYNEDTQYVAGFSDNWYVTGDLPEGRKLLRMKYPESKIHI